MCVALTMAFRMGQSRSNVNMPIQSRYVTLFDDNSKNRMCGVTGYLETAFVQAILAAGITTQIAHACALGKLDRCPCAQEMDHRTGRWTWTGCEESVEYAKRFTKRFLDSREHASDLLSQIRLHNNKIGRKVCVFVLMYVSH